MKHEIKLDRLNAYYNKVKKYIDNHNLTASEFSTYYMIFKKFVYCGLFSLEDLKVFAQSLLKINLQSAEFKNNETLKKYCIELNNFIQFVECNEKKGQFEDSTIKKSR